MNIATIQYHWPHPSRAQIFCHVVLFDGELHNSRFYDRNKSVGLSSKISNDLYRCASIEQIEAVLMEKYDALPLSASEFLQEMQKEEVPPTDRKFLDLWSAGLSEKELYELYSWVWGGLLNFADPANAAFCAATTQDIVEEFHSGSACWFASAAVKERLAQDTLLEKIRTLLVPEKFESWLCLNERGRIIGGGHKPTKSVILRYLQDNHAWDNRLRMDDQVAIQPGQMQPLSAKYTGQPPCIEFSGNLKNGIVAIPSRFWKFIGAQIESKRSSYFRSAEREPMTASIALAIWSKCVD